jgi:hypothetical protein
MNIVISLSGDALRRRVMIKTRAVGVSHGGGAGVLDGNHRAVWERDGQTF